MYPPGQPPTIYYNYAKPGRTSGLAIASMVLGIVWVYWIGSILAVIFGHIALSQTSRDETLRGRGMAIAGLVLGYVGVGTLLLHHHCRGCVHELSRQTSGGGQASAVTISPLPSRCSTHTLPLRHSSGDVNSHPRRSRAAIVSGMTSPWLHNAVASGKRLQHVQHIDEAAALGESFVGLHLDADGLCGGMKRLDAPQIRTADELLTPLRRRAASRVPLPDADPCR